MRSNYMRIFQEKLWLFGSSSVTVKITVSVTLMRTTVSENNVCRYRIFVLRIVGIISI